MRAPARLRTTISSSSRASRRSRRFSSSPARSRWARCASTASHSSVDALVARRDGRRRSAAASRRASERSSICSRSRRVSATPGRSALLITNTSPISSRPALFACTASPHPGFTTTTVVSASPAISTSTWPTPTVSTRTHGLPTASSTRIASRRGEREAAEVAAGRHRADEHAGVGGVVLHAHAVAEDRAARERGRRVDGEHGDRRSPRARSERDELARERRLPRAGRAGEPDGVGVRRRGDG